jgi:hypothetical protein
MIITDESVTDDRELNGKSLGTHFLRLVNYVSINHDILFSDGGEQSRCDHNKMPYQMARNRIAGPGTHLIQACGCR